MNKTEIKQTLNVLSMVTGDCPHERGVGNGEDKEGCLALDCVDCWKKALSKDLETQKE